MDTKEKRAKRFQQGLRPWIRSKVAVFELLSYAVVVQKAMIIEGESEQFQKDKESRKRKVEVREGNQGQGSSQNQFNKRPCFQQGKKGGFKRPEAKSFRPSGQPQNVSQQKFPRLPMPDCKICGKKHTRVCNKASIIYFRCNQKGHYASECRIQKPVVTCHKCGKPGHIAKDYRTPITTSNVLRITGPTAESQPRARTFNMAVKEAIHDSNMVAGTLTINFVPAKVLIDSGATKSFISRKFVQQVHCQDLFIRECIDCRNC